ncbi:MAG: hypothetical protein ABEI52_01795, partial [Halobacteriaceae archaeon]
IVAVERIGSGRVIAVSDPSIFINSMVDQPGNRKFTRAILGSGIVLLDYSHARSQPPLAKAILSLRSTPFLQAVIALIGVGLLLRVQELIDLAAQIRRDVFDRKATSSFQHSESKLIDILQSRYPGWDRKRLERVAQGVLERRRGDVNDE